MYPIDLSSLVYVVKRLNCKQIWPEFEEIHNKYEKHKYYSFKHIFVTMVTKIKIILSDL